MSNSPRHEAHSTEIAEELLDSTRTLSADVLCRNCGYNLRGLPLDHECPECNFSVRRSAIAHCLPLSNTKWAYVQLRGLENCAMGGKLLIYVAVGSIVWFVISLFVYVLGSDVPMFGFLLCPGLFVAGFPLLMSVGFLIAAAFRLTEPDDSWQRPGLAPRTRKPRIVIWLGLGALFAAVVFAAVDLWTMQAIAWFAALSAALFTPATLVSRTAEMAELINYSKLAAELRLRSRTLKVVCAVFLTLVPAALMFRSNGFGAQFGPLLALLGVVIVVMIPAFLYGVRELIVPFETAITRAKHELQSEGEQSAE
jgi:hypothetical protein